MNKTIITIILLSVFELSGATENKIPIGRILEIKGSGFISFSGETHEARKGMLVYNNSEITSEHSGHITYADNLDHQFHLSAGSTMAITDKLIELRNGDVWFQSVNKNEEFKIQTANGIVDFNSGEGILTWDGAKGKTQLMVISGLMKISNLRTHDLNVSVSEGNFSYVDNSYDEGAPRDPTPVGSATYKALLAQFDYVKPLDKNAEKIFQNKEVTIIKKEKNERSLASVSTNDEIPLNDGKTKLEAYRNSMLGKKSAKVLKKGKQTKVGHSKNISKSEFVPLEVHIYGLKTSHKTFSNEVETSSRAPASIDLKAATQNSQENKLEQKIENKPTPNKETEKLLDQLNKL